MKATRAAANKVVERGGEKLNEAPIGSRQRRCTFPRQNKSDLRAWQIWLRWVAAALLLAPTMIAQSQPTLHSSSFSAFGSTSTGGTFTLRSAVGTTGGRVTASGGSFSVMGNPWIVAVVESPGAPRLKISAAAGAVGVTWPSPSTGWVLQQNTNGISSVSWSNVTTTIQDDGTNKTLIVSPPSGNRFFRLFKP